MAKIIFTPWKEQAQLLAVRSQFYPPLSYEGPDMRANACSIVGSWKLRGNLPHPVEATALLTDAILHDDAQKNSIFSIRATYSAAFCRFVTGLVDSKLGGQRKTMFQRAIDLGLPASFVELRHEATHRELPSLIVLRNAAQRSLEWLWDYYWAKVDQSAAFAPAVSDLPGSTASEVEEPIKAAIQDTIEQCKAETESAEPPRKKRKQQHQQSAMVAQLSSICKASSRGAFVLSRVLLDDSILVPAGRKLGESLHQMFSEWDQLLQMIIDSHPPFLSALTEEMANELAFPSDSNSKSDPFREGIYMWLDHILTSQEWTSSRRLLSSTYILTACDENPNYWTKSLKETLRKRKDAPLDTSHLRTRTEEPSDMMDRRSEDSEALRKFGWDTPDKWDSRPLGIA